MSMKKCLICNRLYEDADQRFCLTDGGELVSAVIEEQAQTVLMRGPIPSEQIAQKPQPSLEEWAPSSDIDLTVVLVSLYKAGQIAFQLGDLKWSQLLRGYLTGVQEAVRRKNGCVVAAISDYVISTFRTELDAIAFASEIYHKGEIEYALPMISLSSGYTHLNNNMIFGLNLNILRLIHENIVEDGIYATEKVMNAIKQLAGPDTRFVFYQDFSVGIPSHQVSIYRVAREGSLIHSLYVENQKIQISDLLSDGRK